MTTTKTQQIQNLSRQKNDTDGTPQWEVTFADASVARTAPGSQVNYSIENPEFQDAPVTVTYDEQGRVIGVSEV